MGDGQVCCNKQVQTIPTQKLLDNSTVKAGCNNLNRLYQKSRIWFAVFWIVIYVVGTSAADEVSKAIQLEKSITLLYLAVLTAILVVWLTKNGLLRTYGLCKPEWNAKQMLYYVPLILIASCNLWFGVTVHGSVAETALYICSMLLVGFVEELIFRGFLFEAMRKDSLKAAVIVSSLTFGIGHIVNLVNGSGAELVSNICQVLYAIAAGFLFVIIFLKTGSLWPCIITHSVLNGLSAFAAERTQIQEIITAVVLCVVPLLYGWYICKNVTEKDAL